LATEIPRKKKRITNTWPVFPQIPRLQFVSQNKEQTAMNLDFAGAFEFPLVHFLESNRINFFGLAYCVSGSKGIFLHGARDTVDGNQTWWGGLNEV
jgi:hypothetical protein